MTFLCPICGYGYLDEPPYDEYLDPDYDICPSCGVEYGLEVEDIDKIGKVDYDNVRFNLPTLLVWWKILRDHWIKEGCPWRDTVDKKPAGWDPKKQLKNVGYFLKKYEKTGKLDFSL